MHIRDTSHRAFHAYIFAGKKLRTFEGPVDEYAVGTAAGAGGAVNWPLFKWAGGSTDK